MDLEFDLTADPFAHTRAVARHDCAAASWWLAVGERDRAARYVRAAATALQAPPHVAHGCAS